MSEAIPPSQIKKPDSIHRRASDSTIPKCYPVHSIAQVVGYGAIFVQCNNNRDAMPPAEKYKNELSRLTADERGMWLKTYNDALGQTGDDNKAYLAAWGAVNKMPYSVKSIAGKGAIVGGWGMLFTDPDNLDLEGEYFDSATETLLDYYTNAPLWFEHGADMSYGGKPIGKRVDAKVYPRGIWVEHELDESHPLYEKTLQKIRAGELAYSSDAVGHYVETDAKGRLDNWYAAGWSLTENPAEPALGAVTTTEFKSFITRAKSQRTDKDGAGEPAVTEAGAVGSKNTKPLSVTTGDYKMLAESELTALQTQVLEGFDSLIASVFEQIRSANSEGGDEEDDATRMSDEDEDEMKNAMEAEAKSIADIDAVKNSEDFKTAYEIAIKSIVNVGLNEFQSRIDERMALKQATDNAVKSAMQEASYKDRTPVTKPAPRVHNPSAKSNKMSAPNINTEASKHPFGSFLKSILDPNKNEKTKAQSYGVGRLGGFLQGAETSSEIIPALKDKLILTQLGVRQQSISGETYEFIKHTSRATTYAVGEGQTIPETEVAFDKIIAVTRPYAARVLIPNKMLSESIVNMEQFVMDEMQEELLVHLEYDALFGAGATTSPNVGSSFRGLLNITGVTKTVLNSTPDLDDLSAMQLRLHESNIREDDTWGWAFSPRTRNTFVNAADTTGQPLIRQNWADGPQTTLLGNRYETTTNIPNNSIGTSDGESYIFLGSWRNALFTTSTEMEFLVNPYRYADQLVTELTCYMFCDFVTLRDEAFEILTDVQA